MSPPLTQVQPPAHGGQRDGQLASFHRRTVAWFPDDHLSAGHLVAVDLGPHT
ncbi:MAG TPA: hypothetical protein VE441_06770 [Mycobacterium sp.]|nr:hypothetical protein [Mycobacterium sp.]